MSVKNIKENWEWDESFPKPGTEITFRTPAGEMSGVVSQVINKHVLMVDSEDGREIRVVELLDGGWMERDETRALTVHEWGGAGFSYGSSIFPVNRGGQMNRGGFGGANNLGGPNMMYTYEIKPLNRLLQPKPNEVDDFERIHDGHVIEGEELNKKNGKILVGTVLQTVYADDGSIKYYVIIDEKDSIKKKIDPTTTQLLSGDNHVDPRNKEPGRDEADLERAGQMQETYRAKLINKTLNEGGAFKSRKHYLLGTTLANADEDKFEDVVYDIWPDITGDIFSKSVVQIANRVPDGDIDGYLARLQ